MKQIIILFLLLLLACTQGLEKPTFVITDDQYPNEKVLCYVSKNQLEEHGLTSKKYQEILIALFESYADGMVSASFGGGADSNEEDRLDKVLKTVGLTRDDEVLNDLLKHTRLEHWKLKPDGTYTVEQLFSNK